MKLFDALDQVRQLSPERQQEFEQFDSEQFHTRLYPLFTDISIVFAILGTVVDMILRAGKAASLSVIHPLSYLYFALLLVLLLLNRREPLRIAYPVMAYLLFFLNASFNSLAFVGTKGDMGVFVGWTIALPGLGMNTMSVRHTTIMLLIFLLMLFASVALITPLDQVGSRYLDLVLNWLLLFEMILALTLARFFRWLIAHSFAQRYLLQERNEELAKALRDLHATEDQLIQQQKHQALSHMASGLLHELVNPVNNALQALGFARARSRDNDVNDAIDDAMLNQKRIAAIITDLRAFAQNSAPAAREQVALDTLIDQALKLCAAELAGIEIQREGKIDQPVACFPNALTQVLVNLLLNAGDALKERKKTGAAQITIRVQSESGLIRICLHDNGKGIAPEHLKRLAEPFYSIGKEGIDKDGPNMGLGLSICQTIMSHHDGRMWIKSELGNWTEVCLELPELTRI